ncbi:MAG: hypothetical protein AB7O67_04270 [Vicinamibacterales bacterium]
MKILFAAGHFGFLRNFESGLRELAARGHRIHLVADRRDSLGGMRTVERLAAAYPDAFTWSVVAPPKTHVWRALGTGFRLSLDYWRYLDPQYDAAPALRGRASEQVPAFAAPLAKLPLARVGAIRAVLARAIRMCERSLPPSPHVDQVLDEVAPDVVVVTPLLYFGSQQVDYVRGAKRRHLPTMLAVGSWDHLTTKGLIHEIPDAVTVWNEAQRVEAGRFHGVAPGLVRVTGATAYDHWFDAEPSLDRAAFCARVGLPADRPILLYLCSSPFIAPYEVGFVRSWIEGIRGSADPALREAALLIRPHPQNAEQWRSVDLSGYPDVAIWPREGANPVDQEARNDYYHSMFYSAAVVGVNTSALIESGIVGRPVYSIRAAEFSATQEGTLHFQHLKGVSGGLLTVADSVAQHCEQLSAFLASPEQGTQGRRAFIGSFVRPQGLDVPACRVFADVVESLPTAPRRAPRAPALAGLVRRILYPVAVAAQAAARRPARRPTADGEKPRARRVLFVMSSPEYLRFYDQTLRYLAAGGTEVLVAVNAQREGKPVRIEQFAGGGDGIRFAGIVPPRGDRWSGFADAVRGTMDFVRYLDPQMRDVPVLRARMKRKCLPRALQWLDLVPGLPRPLVRALLGGLAGLERAVPVSDAVLGFVHKHEPDALCVTPLVEAASPQVDLVRAAAALGVPTCACIASWDNLTNKGLLRVQPDLVTVWNGHQAREAADMHGVEPSRIAVTGAQPFDRWFDREPSRTREAFAAMLGLDPARPIVLFTGSSFFISGEQSELPFVRRWIEALRRSPDARLREANVLVRPHPYNAAQWREADLSDLGPAAIFPKGQHNPTDDQNRADFFDSLYHCGAVVGVNTSAMIEAAIVGRPVHAILTPDFAGTQEGTVHFRYLLPENGGFLRVGRTFEEHLAQLAASLADPESARDETRRFVEAFIRPRGLERPCVPILAGTLAELAARPAAAPARAGVGARLLRLALAGPVWLGGQLARLAGPAARKERRLWAHHQRKRVSKGLKELSKRAAPRRLQKAASKGSARVGGGMRRLGRGAARRARQARGRLGALLQARSGSGDTR